jgi:hypothetical protein
VKEKRDLAAREHFKAECESVGLNWFLQHVGVFEKEEELPINDRQPMLGSSGGMSRKPQDWPTGVPAMVQTTKDKIVALRQRLALLEKLEAHVAKIGGWEVFLTDYNIKIEDYVAEQEREGKLREGVR